MNRVESFITAHIGDKINECDDNFSINQEGCRFAVADGSSSDFFSNIYARLLADTFAKEGEEMFSEDRIKGINATWRNLVQHKLDEAGCKPGSFPYVRFQKLVPGCSTLIGLHIYEVDGAFRYNCSGLGDSVIFFIANGEKIPSLQFSSYSNEQYTLDQTVEFGYVPIISNSYSTKWLEEIKKVEKDLQIGVFYLVTDGLAEWILRKDNGDISEKFEVLNNIHTQESFLSYVDDIRSRGAHNDDMTLMKVYVDTLSLSFDSSSEKIYDYRSTALEIEKEELAKRQLSLEKVQKQSEQQKAIAAFKKSETDKLVAAAMARVASEKQQEESLEKRKRNNINDIIIEAAKTKVADVNEREIDKEDETQQNETIKRDEQSGMVEPQTKIEGVGDANCSEEKESNGELNDVREKKVSIDSSLNNSGEACTCTKGIVPDNEQGDEENGYSNLWEKNKKEANMIGQENRKEQTEQTQNNLEGKHTGQKDCVDGEKKNDLKNSVIQKINLINSKLFLVSALIVCVIIIFSQNNNYKEYQSNTIATIDSISKLHDNDSIVIKNQKDSIKIIELRYNKALKEIDVLKQQNNKQKKQKK